MIDFSTMGVGELDMREMEMINGGEGGGFWYDVAYAIGATARYLYENAGSGGPSYECAKVGTGCSAT